jgi:hypothetical protein
MAINWNEVAAVATGGAAVVALVGVGITTYLTRRQIRQDRGQFEQDGLNRDAAAVRAALHEFEGVMRAVCLQIRDGAPIISMSWLTAAAVIDLARQSTEDDNAALDKLQELVRSGSPFLSLWIRASESSPAAARLFDEAAQLPYLGSKVRGEFSITSYLGDMIATMVNDIKVVLLTALDGEDGARLRELIVSEYLQGDGWANLQVGLATALHSNLGGYIQIRYSAATRTIESIVRVLVASGEALTSAQLTAASAADVDGPMAAPTLTMSMRALARQLSDRLGHQAASDLDRLIDQLEQQIAKPGRSPAGP